jgi:hypothetical protein
MVSSETNIAEELLRNIFPISEVYSPKEYLMNLREKVSTKRFQILKTFSENIFYIEILVSHLLRF